MGDNIWIWVAVGVLALLAVAAIAATSARKHATSPRPADRETEPAPRPREVPTDAAEPAATMRAPTANEAPVRRHPTALPDPFGEAGETQEYKNSDAETRRRIEADVDEWARHDAQLDATEHGMHRERGDDTIG